MDVEAGGRLIESSLWKEDVYTSGHSSVWGSLYDPEAKRWGYACCRGVKRESPCAAPEPKQEFPRAAGSTAKASGEESDSGKEVTSPDTEAEDEAKPFDFSNPPPELLPSQGDSKKDKRKFIEHFVKFILEAWRKKEADGFPNFGDMERGAFTRMRGEAEKGLTPLMWRLKKGESLDRGEARQFNKKSRETRTSMESKFVQEKCVLTQVYKMTAGACEGEYVKAHEAYMQLTFGNKMWNLTHVTHVAACTMKGAREYRRNRDSLNTYDMCPVSQRYMHALKKLIHFCQCIRPNEDQSKNFVM